MALHQKINVTMQGYNSFAFVTFCSISFIKANLSRKNKLQLKLKEVNAKLLAHLQKQQANT